MKHSILRKGLVLLLIVIMTMGTFNVSFAFEGSDVLKGKSETAITLGAKQPPEAISGLVYNGESQALVNISADYKYYKVGAFGSVTESAPTAKEPGTYTVYYGITKVPSNPITVNIAKAPITSVVLNEPTEFTYDGAEKEVSIAHVYATGGGNKQLEVAEKRSTTIGDYTQWNASGLKTSSTGEHTVTVTAADDGTLVSNYFTDSATAKWSINKSYEFSDGALKIKGADDQFAVEAAGYEFTGDSITPEFKVEADGTELRKDVDYVVVSEGSTTSASEIGEYTITVQGIGDYNDDANIATAKWYITGTQFKEMSLSAYTNVYDGNAFKPTVTEVKDTKDSIVDSNNYTYIYMDSNGQEVTDPTNAGTYKVEVTAKSGTGYYGSIDSEFTITKASLPENAVEAVSGLVYNGKDQALVVENLPEGCNAFYKTGLVVGDNTTEHDAIPTAKDASTTYVYYRIDGGQNYESKEYDPGAMGIWRKDFDGVIGQAPIYSIEFNESLPYTYTGKDQTVTIKQVLAGKEGDLVECPAGSYNTSGKLTGNTVGEYEVTVSAKGIATNFKSSCTTKWSIEKKEISEDWVSIKNLLWTGNEESAEIIVVDPDLNVELDEEDYTVTGEQSGIAPREYFVTITGTGNYTGTVEKTWKILDLVANLNHDEFTYDGSDHAVELTVAKINGEPLGEGVAYEVISDESTFKEKNAGEYVIKIRGLGEYSDIDIVELKWTIKKAELTSDYIKLKKKGLTIRDNYIYDGTEKEVSLEVKQALQGGKYLPLYEGEDKDYVIDKDKSTLKATDAGTYTVSIKATEDGNYSGEASATWEIQGIPMDWIVVTVDQNSFEYDGEVKEPKVKVGLLGNILVEDEDYEILGAENGSITSATDVYRDEDGNVSYYTIKVKGKKYFKDIKEVKWQITPAKIQKDWVLDKRDGECLDGKNYALTNGPGDNIVVNKKGKLLELNDYLTKDIDYSISQDSTLTEDGNGVFTVTIIGKGNYSDAIEDQVVCTWSKGAGVIYDIDIQNSYLDPISQMRTVEYDSTEVIPVITLKKHKDGTLIGTEEINTDSYKAEGDLSATDAGTYKIRIVGNGKQDFWDTIEIPWKITPRRVVSYWDNTKLVYNGTAQKPDLKFYHLSLKDLMDENAALVDDVTVNVQTLSLPIIGARTAGTYTAYATLSGTYNPDNYNFFDLNLKRIEFGSSQIWYTDFEITPRPVDVVWSEETEFTYDGKSHVPTATASKAKTGEEDNGTGVVGYDSCQLTVEGAEINAGDHIATVKGISSNTNYVLADKTEVSKAFKIVERNINNGNFKVTDATFTGNTITPAVTGTDRFSLLDTRTLTYGKDFTCVVKDSEGNIVDEPKNAGTYTLEIVGQGNYQGTHSQKLIWKINKAVVDIPTAGTTSFVYNGNKQTYTPERFDPDLMEISGNAETNAGNYTATVTLKDPENSEWKTDVDCTFDWTIAKATATAGFTETPSCEYDGTPHTPEVTVNCEDTVLEEGVGNDYTVAYSNNTYAGTATATVTLSDNYEFVYSSSSTNTKALEFTIAKATPIVSADATAIDYGQTLADSTLSAAEGSVVGTYTWADSSIKPTVNNNGFTVNFVPKDSDNYNETTCVANITVNKVDATTDVFTLTPTSATYKADTEQGTTVTWNDANESGDAEFTPTYFKIKADGSDEDVALSTKPIEQGKYHVYVAVSGANNYNDSAKVLAGTFEITTSGGGGGGGGGTGGGGGGEVTPEEDKPEEEGISVEGKNVEVGNAVIEDGKLINPSVKVDGEQVADDEIEVVYAPKVNGYGIYQATIIFKGKYVGTYIVNEIKVAPQQMLITKNTAGKKRATIKWNKLADVTGYQLKLSTKKNFTKKTTKTITIKKANKAKSVVKKLKKGKRYYAKIRAFKTVKVGDKNVRIYGEWSKLKRSKKLK